MAIRTDQGGELAGSEKFNKIANLHGYSIERTAAGSSSQNGIAERPNETIGNTLQTMLMGAGIEDKYWSDALLHSIFIKNRLPHTAFRLKSTPYTEMTGKRPNLEKLRVFGCPVTVHKPGRRRSKLVQNVYNGIFLQFANTFETCKYIDTKSKRVKYARIQRDRFDEAHFTIKDPPVGGQALKQAGHPQTKRVPTARLPITVTEQETPSP